MWVFHIHNSFDWVDTPWPWDLKFELKHKFVFVCSHYEHETFQTCFENFSQIKVPTCYGLRLSSTRCRVWFNCTLSLHFYNDRHPLFGQPLTWKPPNPLSHWWLWLRIRTIYTILLMQKGDVSHSYSLNPPPPLQVTTTMRRGIHRPQSF
jgi:hypothetical protein